MDTPLFTPIKAMGGSIFPLKELVFCGGLKKIKKGGGVCVWCL